MHAQLESYGQSNFGGTWDFAAVVYRMQCLGMNAVRLPFSFQVRAEPSFTSQPTLQGLAPLAAGPSGLCVCAEAR